MAEPKTTAEDTVNPPHQQPYPTGDPQDADGREVFKAAHGHYPDEPPVGTPPGQATEELPPEGGVMAAKTRAKAEPEEDDRYTRNTRKGK